MSDDGLGGPFTLVTPADPRCVIVARTTAAAIATVAGATVEEVEDLRLVVSEACSLMLDLDRPDDACLAMGLRVESPSLVLTFSLQGSPPAQRPGSDLAWTLLGALVSEASWDVDATRLTVSCPLLLSSSAGS